MADRTPYDQKPFYCVTCGAGFNEYGACEEIDCKLETQTAAIERFNNLDQALTTSKILPFSTSALCRWCASYEPSHTDGCQCWQFRHVYEPNLRIRDWPSSDLKLFLHWLKQRWGAEWFLHPKRAHMRAELESAQHWESY